MYNVLIIDDEPWSRQVVKTLVPWESLGLQQAGEAEDGREGLRLADELSPHIIITDMRMPGIDGVELLQQLNDQYPEIKIIVMSGYDDWPYLKQAIRSRAVEYLLKPIDADELLGALSRCLAELREAASRYDGADDAGEPFLFADSALLNGYLATKRQVYALMREFQAGGVEQAFLKLQQELTETLTPERQKGMIPQLAYDFILMLQEFLAENGLSSDYARDPSAVSVTEWSSITQAMNELGSLYVIAIREAELLRRSRGSLSIAAIQAYIDKHYGEPISLETIAQQFFVSKEHLSRLFKASAGENLTDYLHRRRMERARELIVEQGYSIKHVAELTGYADLTYFYRVFKKHFGITPGDLRKEE
ncbi:response regulator [Paenibacillus filicis]|uniref:Response regulator n=1 Tax=Paenibacillus filicis TaxID=669464 RepID=A0ABU9DNY7_9BACL